MDIEEAKKNLKIMMRTFDIQAPNINVRNVETLKKQTIETVLQELESYQIKEKSRIIGNIYEIKIEDLEPVLKPYYISKDKVRQMIINLRASCTNNSTNNIYNNQINNQIRILEELLEDK